MELSLNHQQWAFVALFMVFYLTLIKASVEIRILKHLNEHHNFIYSREINPDKDERVLILTSKQFLIHSLLMFGDRFNLDNYLSKRINLYRLLTLSRLVIVFFFIIIFIDIDAIKVSEIISLFTLD